MRLFGVRPGTAPSALGIERGDRLESIHGMDLSAPERALDTYSRLRTVSGVSVRLRRRGTEVDLRYLLR